MILVFISILAVILAIYFHLIRYFLIIIMSLFFVFGHIAVVVSDNMAPNINTGDYLLCIRPTINYINNQTIIADLRKIPIIGKFLEYKQGQTIIIKSNRNTNNMTIIKPKIFRIICDENNVLKIRNNNLYVNNLKIRHEKFYNYLIEKLPNNKSYLITKKHSVVDDTIVVSNNKVLCMYDNRDIENGVMTILDKKLIHSIPIINLTNIYKYYKFLVN